MKLAYEFDRYQIRTHDITHFQSLFGIDRLKTAMATDRTLALNMIGSMRIFFELNENCSQPHEDPDIRKLCGMLVEESPALFLATTSDRTMSLLFYTTLMNFTAVSFEEESDWIRFDSDITQARKHEDRFQKRILAISEKLGVSKTYSMEHCAKMKMLFR